MILYFLDCDMVPFSECCNEPIFIKIDDSSVIYFICTSKACSQPILVELFVGTSLKILQKLKKTENFARKLVSNYIITGKFKKTDLSKKLTESKGKLEGNSILTDLEMSFFKENKLNFIKSARKIQNPRIKLLERYQFKVSNTDIDPRLKYRGIMDKMVNN